MKSYAKLLRYAQPYKLVIALSIVSSIIFVIFNAISLWIISSLVTLIMDGEPDTKIVNGTSIYQSLQSITGSIIIGDSPIEKLKSLCFILFFAFVGKNIFYYINNICLSYAKGKIITDIRNELYAKLISLPISFFDNRKSADISSISIRDVSMMREAFTQTIQNLINEPINIAVFLILLFIINPYMTIVILLVIPFSGFIVYKIGDSIKRKAKRSSRQIGGVMDILHDTIRGIKVVKSFSLGKILSNKFLGANERFRVLLLKQDKLRHLITPINDMIGVSIGIALLWIIGSSVLIVGGGIGSGDFIKYIVYLFAMLQPSRKLSNVNAVIQSGLASAERVFSIIDHQNERASIAGLSKMTFKSKIVVNKLMFRYSDDGNYAINDINLTINKNEIVSIVGESGAGKSTFANLMLGFYTKYAGTIEFDGIDVKNIDVNDLRKHISYVSQDTILFNDTIIENIRFGDPDALDDDVIEAAKKADAFDFIENFEDGFYTKLHENGSNLSGGQRQRISIARAILKNAPILILDEATSSLDNDTDRKIQDALIRLFVNRTVVIISHRLSTVKMADKIFVFENGRIAEEGKHKELIDNNGIYKSLFERKG